MSRGDHLGSPAAAITADTYGQQAGYPNGRSVVRDGWMKSARHRANILRPRYRRMAVAARRRANGRWYLSQVFGGRLL